MYQLVRLFSIIGMLFLTIILAMQASVKAETSATQTSKLIAAAPVADSAFGYAAAVSGTTAVIGAPSETVSGASNVGAAYVFTFNGTTWTQAVRLTASDGQTGDLFGTAVAIDGGTIVIGARGDDDGGGNVGAAYVFTGGGNGWLEADKLIPSSNSDNAIGFAAAIDGNTIAISGPFTGSGTTNSGAVYIYEYEATGGSWTETQRLTTGGSGAVLSDSYGWSLALSGSVLAVGAPQDDLVYVYTPGATQWEEATTLSGSDTANGDEFGYAVATDGVRILVGAGDDDDAGVAAGSAFVFALAGSSWLQEAKLVPTTPSPLSGSNFGRAVAIVGGTAVVGAPNSKGLLDAEETGAAYAYQMIGSTWQYFSILTASDAAQLEHLGTAVALGSDVALIGAPDSVTNPADAGAVYTFAVPSTPAPDPTPDPGAGELCPAEEQTSEEVLPGTNLTFGSAHRCTDVPEQGQYQFTVSLAAEASNTATVVVDNITLTHTTPRPLGQAPEADIDQMSGLPKTLAAGNAGSFTVNGSYELVTTGEGQKANLHFCASGRNLATNEPFYLGVNLFLRGPGALEGDENGGGPPAISNVDVTAGPLSATITWQTDQPATSELLYYPVGKPEMEITLTRGCLAVQHHEVVVNDLFHGTHYEFQVQSRTGLGDMATSDVYSFSTTELSERVYLPAIMR